MNKLIKICKDTLFIGHDRDNCVVCQGTFLQNILYGALTGVTLFIVCALLAIILSLSGCTSAPVKPTTIEEELHQCKTKYNHLLRRDLVHRQFNTKHFNKRPRRRSANVH